MDNNAVPTKGNLIRAKNSLKLAKQGYTNIVEFGGINSWTGETVSGSEA